MTQQRYFFAVPGKAGWFSYRDGGGDLAGVTVYVRCSLAPSGRLVIGQIDVQAADGGRIDTNVLRDVPLGKIEAAINGAYRARMLARLDEEEDPQPSANVEDTAAYFSRIASKRIEELEAEARPLTGSQLARLATVKQPSRERGRLPDSFYQQVAEKYMALANRIKGPATQMAEANGVPVTTVHRWVKEARARGFLTAGHRGARG